MMATFIAEVLLRIAFHLSDPFTQHGENLRWTVEQYFRRFKFMPPINFLTLDQVEQEKQS